MTDPVTLDVRDGIGLITVDNPPVNALARDVRAGLQTALRHGIADSAVKALVICCAGRTFMAGADIREFDAPMREPHLTRVTAEIEAASKPVVAAVHGTALGGGFEVALGCHYRVATADAKVGLPEVNLGIIPGAGGTQRLPRLVGCPAALDIALSGRHVPATEALQLGAIDEIADGDLVEAARSAARRLHEGQRLRRTNAIPIAAAALPPGFFAAQRAQVAAQGAGFAAPPAIVDAVERAVFASAAEGLAREFEVSAALKMTTQSKAMRYLFFGARAVAKTFGKIAFLSGHDPGSIGGRLFGAYAGEAIRLVADGATPAQVDAALCAFGMRIGPFAAMERLGIENIPAAADASRDVVKEEVGQEEIVRRCTAILINTGAKLLDEGAASHPVAVDVVFCDGYGFPRYRGGPMFHADTLGLRTVIDDLGYFARATGSDFGYWTPSPLLLRLVDAGKNFKELAIT